MARTRVAMLALTAALASLCAPPAAEAARLRYAGRAASDAGGFVRVSTTLRSVTRDTFAGPWRCRATRPSRCIARRGKVTLLFTSDGFDATFTLGRKVECQAIGSGTPFSSLVGEYICERGDETVDGGVFQLDLRRR